MFSEEKSGSASVLLLYLAQQLLPQLLGSTSKISHNDAIL